MPITKDGNGTIQQTEFVRKDLFDQTGAASHREFAVAHHDDVLKQVVFDPSAQATNTKVTIASGANSANITLTLPATSGTLSTAAGGASFKTMQVPAGTSPTAVTPTDTLTFTSSDSSITITGNSSTDTIDLKAAVSGTSANTPSTLVQRDGSGNFAAGTITANLTGNASGTASNVTGTVTEAHGGTNQTTYTAGDILYASASNTLSKLPAGSEQSRLVISGGVPAYANAINRGGCADIEDFITWNTTSMKLTYLNTGGSVAGADSTANAPSSAHPGIWKYTSTAATDKAGFVVTQNISSVFCFGGGETITEAIVYFSALSDATNTFTFYSGFNNGSTSLNTEYAVFQYTHSANSGNWQGLVKTAGTQTTLNTSSAVAATTWYRLTVVVNAAGTRVDFYVNGTNVGNVTSNIPPDGQLHGMQPNTMWIRSAGTASKYVIWDYVAWSQVVTR